MRAPIWPARRTRCASPPERVVVGPVEGQVADAHRAPGSRSRSRISRQERGPPPAARAPAKASAAKRRHAPPPRAAARSPRSSARPGGRPGSPAAGARRGRPGRPSRSGRGAGPRRPRAAVGPRPRPRGPQAQQRLQRCAAGGEGRRGTVVVPVQQGLRAPGAGSSRDRRVEREAVARRPRPPALRAPGAGRGAARGGSRRRTSERLSSGMTLRRVHVPAPPSPWQAGQAP